MDIYTRLTADHERQRALAARIKETTGASEERKRLFDQLVIELQAHAAAEEQTLYSALIEHPDGQDEARHSIVEHEELEEIIEALQKMDMSHGSWLQKFGELEHDMLHHLDEEEADVFPLGRKLIDKKRAAELARIFDERKPDEEHFAEAA